LESQVLKAIQFLETAWGKPVHPAFPLSRFSAQVFQELFHPWVAGQPIYSQTASRNSCILKESKISGRQVIHSNSFNNAFFTAL